MPFDSLAVVEVLEFRQRDRVGIARGVVVCARTGDLLRGDLRGEDIGITTLGCEATDVSLSMG